MIRVVSLLLAVAVCTLAHVHTHEWTHESRYPHQLHLCRANPTACGYPPVKAHQQPMSGSSSSSGEYTHWMADMLDTIGNRTLAQLILPGTHDAGAYWLNSDIAPDATGSPVLDALLKLAEQLGLPIQDIITPWALSQDASYYDQLNAGIRYLDVRAVYNGSAWRTYHFELGHEIELLMQDIHRFMNEQTNEIVIVEVSHTDCTPPAPVSAFHDLADMIQKQLGAWMLPRTSPLNDTINTMLSRNTRAVVTLDHAAAIANRTSFWPGNTIYNTYADSDVLDTMISYNNDQVSQFNSNHSQCDGSSTCLFKLSWTLTPQADTILGSILPGHPHSLLELANVANKALDAWADKLLASRLRLGNILIIDHFETSDIVQVVLNAIKANTWKEEEDIEI